MAEKKLPGPTPTNAAPAADGGADALKSDEANLLSLLDLPESEETTSETTEGEAETTEDTAEADSTEEEAPPAKLYEVRPDGKPEKVTLDEALRGYTGQLTIQRRLQDVALERKAFQTERAGELAKVTHLRDEYAKRLDLLAKTLEDGEPEPDWDALRRDKPTEYPQAWADWHRRETRRQKVAQERGRVAEQQEAEALEHQESLLVEEQRKLHEVLPDLADRVKGPALKARLVAGAESYGYNQADVESVTDHRAIRLLHDALAYRDLLQRKAQLGKTTTTSSLPPGRTTEQVVPVPRARREAYDRLKKTGSHEDAVEVFLWMLETEERQTTR